MTELEKALMVYGGLYYSLSFNKDESIRETIERQETSITMLLITKYSDKEILELCQKNIWSLL